MNRRSNRPIPETQQDDYDRQMIATARARGIVEVLDERTGRTRNAILITWRPPGRRTHAVIRFCDTGSNRSLPCAYVGPATPDDDT